MRWNQRYRLRSYVRASLWLIPFIAIPLELATVRLLRVADLWLGGTFLDLEVPGAEVLLQTIISLTIALVVFTLGFLLVAIQVASGYLTPRIIATTLLQDNVVKYALGLFIFTMLFATSVADRIEATVPQLVIFVAAVLGVLCFSAFLYLIDYAAKLLRPIAILARVGTAGLGVIRNVYPDPSLGARGPESQRHKLGPPLRVIPHRGTSQIVLAANLNALMAAAERTNGVIEFAPQVGDFVGVDEPLFNLYGGASEADERELRGAVAFGPERTMEQDPTFAFRIVVDIALKALSPAINDPTTAVLAIDQLQRMLRVVGMRNLRTDELLDAGGQLRVIFRTPNWEDFVHLTFIEIRYCGSSNMQLARRLRAMIQNLIETLPEHRHLALQQELTLLNRAIEKHFPYAEDTSLALIPDAQGLGGHSGMEAGR